MLVDRGHEVCGLDSDLFRRCTYGALSQDQIIPMIERDIREVQVEDLAGFDAVLHLAGLSNDPLGDMRPELTDEINHKAAVRLGELTKKAGVERFVFSSTCSNYGAGGNDFLTEDSPFNPQTPYGVAKVAAEGGLLALADDSFSPVILRSSTACGDSPRIRFDLVVNNLTAWAATTGRVHLKSDGMVWRPIVHIEDIARAFIAVTEAERSRVHTRAYNVGQTEENYLVRDIAKIVHETVPGSEIEIGEGASRDTRNYRVNCDRIRKELPEFQPQWTVRKSAKQVYEAIKRRGLTLEGFEGDRYQRLAHIKMLQSEQWIEPNLLVRSRPSIPFTRRTAEACCRVCGEQTLRPVLDLGMMPPSDGLLPPDADPKMDPKAPLEYVFCESCSLSQIIETLPAEKLFGEDYLYFSSYSADLLEHSKRNAEELIESLNLGKDSLVVELASNDGYMLKNFVEKDIPVLGIDPAPKQAEVANAAGVRTLCEFFGEDLAKKVRQEHGPADLIMANNVLAHVTDTHGFVAGMAELISDEGTICIEAPYAVDLIDHNEFDTIYHEHLCYFTVHSLVELFSRHGLSLNDVRRIPIHGGSLRLYVQKKKAVGESVKSMLAEEIERGVTTLPYYSAFGDRVMKLRESLRDMLVKLRDEGKRVAAYGAAAKGTIMLNFVGVGTDLIECAYDRNPHKHNRLMPGVRVPVRSLEQLREDPPDVLLILPWNFKDEIMRQEAAFHENGGRFIVPVPEPTLI
jgi:nucleoside-diphosphate-sugar epimerase